MVLLKMKGTQMTVAPPKRISRRKGRKRRSPKRPARRLAPPPGTKPLKRTKSAPESPSGAPALIGQRPEPRKGGAAPRTVQALHKQMEEWMAEAFTKMGAPELIGKIPWNWNSRMTSTMGRAHFRRTFNGVVPTKMDFAPLLFKRASAQDQRQTVFHECAHIVDYHKGTYVSSKPHGPSWKRYMRKAGVPAKRCHKIRPVGRVKVWCLCTTHHVTKKKRAKVKAGHVYRCTKCRSKITWVKPKNR